MSRHKEVKISYWAAHLTTIVSVTLVLVIIGIIALITIGASRETQKLRGSLEMSVILTDSVSDVRGKAIANSMRRLPYAAQVRYISRAEAMKTMSAEVDENLEEVLGVNFLSPEINVTLSSDYSSPAKIKQIETSLNAMTDVDTAAMPEAQMVEKMNSNIERLSLILGAIAIVMGVISIVLIHNTVRLAIYSRRFTIHTMQLVGATNGFIRRPFVLNNMLCGLIAAVLASAILCGLILSGSQDIGTLVDWVDIAVVCGMMLAVSLVICSLSAAVATTRYLRKDYGELFI